MHLRPSRPRRGTKRARLPSHSESRWVLHGRYILKDRKGQTDPAAESRSPPPESSLLSRSHVSRFPCAKRIGRRERQRPRSTSKDRTSLNLRDKRTWRNHSNPRVRSSRKICSMDQSSASVPQTFIVARV